jgi:CBS domain-containing protein
MGNNNDVVMLTSTNAKRLMIYLGESDTWRGRSLYMSILETMRKSGIAGATVTRAIAGFGAHSRIRTHTIEVLSMDLPIVITIVDTSDNIDRALKLVGPMVREGLITVEDIEIVKYTHRYLHALPADRPVAEIMTRDVTTVTPDTPARQVVELLLGKLFKAVPVVDQERQVVGIITDSDLLRQAGMPVRMAVGERLEANDFRQVLEQVSQEKTSREIMTSPVITIREDVELARVVQMLLDHKLKRMPVVDANHKLVGMVSRLDILRAVAGNGAGQQEQAPAPHPSRTIGEVMSHSIPAVHVNDDLVDVIQTMLKADIKRVIVLDEQEKPIGIITDGDLVARVSQTMRRGVLQVLAARILGDSIRRGHATARELMSENVLSAPPDTPVIDAISLMLQQGRKRLVVVNEQGYALGIVDRQMLLAASIGG